MAVHTKINTSQLQEHLQQYNIGNLVNFSEILQGIDNSNFIINTTHNKYIFTIFENRIKPQELPFFLNLKQHLASKNISCPKPILNNNQQNISYFNNKATAIVSFLDGKTLHPDSKGYYHNITQNHCFQVGETLAKMHLATLDFKEKRINDLSCLNFTNFFSEFSTQINCSHFILQVIDFLQQKWQENLPNIACHLDLFPDNVFFDDKNNLSGVIDFYFAANDLAVYDFAITCNAWCFDELTFNPQKYLALLTGYQKIKPFSQVELNFMPIAKIAASTRFYLTRLHNKIFTSKDALITLKDPSEYLAKLQYFWQEK
jgi:homoserine kinase type II